MEQPHQITTRTMTDDPLDVEGQLQRSAGALRDVGVFLISICAATDVDSVLPGLRSYDGF